MNKGDRCRKSKSRSRSDVVDFGLLLVIESSSVLGGVVSFAGFVAHVFVEDLFAELVRLDDRRVAVEDIDLFERQAFRLWDAEVREDEA